MKRALIPAAIVLAVLGALAIRIVVEGRAALGTGSDWVLRGKPLEAIASYEDAARWYLPLAPHVDAAYDRLRALTTDPDPRIALAAWRAIRSAARATSGLWTPHAADLADADAAIANREARQPGAASPAPTTAGREAWYRDRLARDVRPGHGAAALAALGVLAWIGGAFALARARSGKLARAGIMLAGLLAWAAGLYLA
ncbi:MAG: hypothetical protein JO257_16640 [Deltaproteobacteria bacterium]|nr:hypothetical protein [Deltaproteobacteria bacterium]